MNQYPQGNLEIPLELRSHHVPMIFVISAAFFSQQELHLVMEFLGGGSLDDVLGMRRVLCESQAPM